MACPEPLTELRIFTVGHSTRTQDEFIALLTSHGIGGIADVRRFPGSRRHPHFARESLARWLPESGIHYRHFERLGGRRRPSASSPNDAWEHAAFRGYADYMASAEFQEELDELLGFSADGRVAVMCAEAQWWRCHRRLIADALLVRGVEVRHVMGAGRAPLHVLPPFALVDGTAIVYPRNRNAPS